MMTAAELKEKKKYFADLREVLIREGKLIPKTMEEINAEVSKLRGRAPDNEAGENGEKTV